MFYGNSPVPALTGFKLHLLGPSGLIASYESQYANRLGDGSYAFVERTKPIGADPYWGAAVRIVRGGVVSAPVWSQRMVTQPPFIASLGDGRALVTIGEGFALLMDGSPNLYAEDLNGNGRLGDDVTFLYADGAMANLRVTADPVSYYGRFARLGDAAQRSDLHFGNRG